MKQVRIVSVQTNSGFLERAHVNFSPQLTCVIGARGTCKSTLVESIRFAFKLHTPESKIVSPAGVITKTLGPAGSVRCEVEVEEDGVLSNYIIEREMDAEPRILRNGVRDSFSDELLDELEIYSQGALQEIASEDHLDKRLELVDRPHRSKVKQVRDQIRIEIKQLQSIGPEIRTLRSEIEKRKVEVKNLDSLRAELGATLAARPELPPTLEEQHQSYLRRQRILDRLKEIETLQGEAVQGLSPVNRLSDHLATIEEQLRNDASDASELGDVLTSVSTFFERLSDVIGIRDAIAGFPFASLRSSIFAQFEKVNESYYLQRQQQQAVNESLKREDQVRRRIVELEKLEKELRAHQTRIEQLLRLRRDARLKLNALADQLFELRVQEVDRINKEFGDVVFLTVRRGTHSKQYIERLSGLMSGSRVRTQESIATDIALKLAPSELLDIIETADAQRLAAIVDRDLAQVNRVLIYLRDHPDLYQLEDEPFADVLEITMYDHGQPKPVESLSDGQKATALLPLILRGSSCPLIIDQPEDDLDNSFIFQVLVKNVLRLKDERQLIFVTHNANIPVLGDAEQIVVMHMEKPSKAAPPVIGSVDDCKGYILDLLEGGKEAFEKREQRYSGAK